MAQGYTTTRANITQVGGSAIVIGQAAMAASLPVVLASDQSAIPVTQSGSWSLSANQSVNIAQINGTTPLMGNGASGTGAQRVTIASDSTGQVNAIQSGTWNIGTLTSITNTVTVAGTVTANAGTNLNTSLLALESGGNLAILAGGVSTSKYQVNISQVAGGTAINSGVTGALAVGGDTAAGGTDAGNPVKVGGKFNSTLPTLTDGQRGDLQLGTRGALRVSLFGNNTTVTIGNVVDNADGVAVDSTGNSLKVVNRNTIASPAGTVVWDRQYSVINATNSTGTGITAAGLVAQLDDTSPTAITENQFGNVRMNSVRALYHENGPYLYTRATADTQIKASAGFIHTISIAPTTATPTAGLLTVYDNTAESGTIIFSEWVFATTPGHTITLDVPAATGIYVGYDAALTNVSVTVAYR